MAWGALATGARAATGSTGPGPLADAGVVLRDHAAPSCRSSSSTWRAARATTSRRRAAAATATTATSCSRRCDVAEAVELTQLAFHLADKWRNPVLVYGDYLLAHTCRGGRRSSRSTSAPLPAEGLGASTARAAAPAARATSSPLGVGKARSGIEPGQRAGTCAHRGQARRDRAPREPRVETGDVDDAETGRRRVRHARRASCATSCASCAPRASASATSGRSRCGRSRRDAVARGRARARARVAVLELNAGQMIDDVRLAVLGRAPVDVHRRDLSPTARASASARLLDVEHDPRAHRARRSRWTTTRRSMTPIPHRARRPTRRRRSSSATSSPSCSSTRRAPPVPRLRRAARAARRCSRRSRSSAARSARSASSASAATRRSRATIDVDLVQALHGRAPSRRDRREAHAARRARVHAAGRRRHGERGPAGGAPHRGARRERHLHPAQQRRVRRDRRPHDRDHACSASAPRTRSTVATPSYHGYPILIGDLLAQLEGAAYVARGAVHNAGGRRADEADARARVRDAARGRGLLVRRDPHDVPDRLVHRRRAKGPDYLDEMLGEVHITGELKVDGRYISTPELRERALRNAKPREA